MLCSQGNTPQNIANAGCNGAAAVTPPGPPWRVLTQCYCCAMRGQCNALLAVDLFLLEYSSVTLNTCCNVVS